MISRREHLVNYAILIAFSLFALYPVVGVLTTALTDPGTASGFSLSTDFHFSNFSAAWDQGHFSHYLRSSVIVSVTVVTVSTLLSILSGYAFGLMRFRGATVLFYVFLLGLMVPVEAMVVPLYFDFRRVHLLDTYWALILPQIGQSVTLGTFWMRAFFLSTPRALVEAGRIDGAGSFRILRSVLLPQARPALLTLCLLVFIYTWNEFLLALVLLNGSDNTTAPLGLAFFAGVARAGDPTKVAAASVLVAAPIVIVYLFLQRHFIRGVLAGAIKE
jgi:raffinose/stachyose/melibiose transport system permease protein